jgi:hypothetical protein
MAFTVQEFQLPERWTHFSFFKTQKAASNVESLDPDGQFFKLAEVRLHFSSTFGSTQDFTIRLSSIKGSEYNLLLLSQALSGLRDLLWQPSQALLLLSDDQIVFSWTQVSDVNTLGLNVLGWGVLG